MLSSCTYTLLAGRDSTCRYTFEGMSAPFAQSVAGRVQKIEVSPLRTAAAKRKYQIRYMSGGNITAAPSEIIVNSMWLPMERLAVKVSGDPSVEASIEEHLPGAKLTQGVSYTASAKVVITHKQSAAAAAASGAAADAAPKLVTVTIMAK